MTTIDRPAIARSIAALTTTEDGRTYLARAGYKSGMPVIVADFDDAVGATLDRIRAKGLAGLVVTAQEAGDLLVGVFEQILTGDSVSDEVSRYSSIGLLLTAAQRSRQGLTFKLTNVQVSASAPVKIPEFA